MSFRSLLLPALLLTACGESLAPLPSDVVSSLTQRGGCADLIAYAANATDTVALMIRADGLVDAAYDEGEETPFSFDLASSDEVTVEIVRGEYVTHTTCNDAISHDVVIDETYAARSGGALFVVTPTGEREDWGAPATAAITLTDVVLESEIGARIEIDEFAFTANVGWLPG